MLTSPKILGGYLGLPSPSSLGAIARSPMGQFQVVEADEYWVRESVWQPQTVRQAERHTSGALHLSGVVGLAGSLWLDSHGASRVRTYACACARAEEEI